MGAKNKMIQQLPQVISGLLAIAVAALAAYWIYLNQTSESISERINDEGRSIVRIAEEFPYNKNPFWMGSHLLDKYRELYPDKRDIDLLNHIGNDLLTIGLNPEIDKDDAIRKRFASFSSDDLPVNGRIYFYLMYQYIENALIRRPGAHAAYGFFRETEREAWVNERGIMFPYGPVGLQTWIERYRSIRGPYKILHQWRDVFLKDYDDYLTGLQDPKDKKFYSRFNHSMWLDKASHVFAGIEEPAQRIESLLYSQQSFSTDKRIPHVGYILALCGLSFLIGVIIPLVHLSISNKADEIPTTYNLILLVMAFLPLYGSVHVFVSDLVQQSRSGQRVEYLTPLVRQIRALSDSKLDHVTYGYEYANAVIDSKEVSISGALRKVLIEYVAAVKDSNAISRKISGQLADALNTDTTLGAHKSASGGGLAVSILDPLTRPAGIHFEIGQMVLFEIEHDGYLKDAFVLQMPHDAKESLAVKEAVKQIYTGFTKKEQYSAYMKARSSLATSVAILRQTLDKELRN